MHFIYSYNTTTTRANSPSSSKFDVARTSLRRRSYSVMMGHTPAYCVLEDVVITTNHQHLFIITVRGCRRYACHFYLFIYSNSVDSAATRNGNPPVISLSTGTMRSFASFFLKQTRGTSLIRVFATARNFLIVYLFVLNNIYNIFGYFITGARVNWPNPVDSWTT